MNRTALPLPTPRGLAALATLCVGLLLAAAPLRAQDADPAEDPPARVGRVAALIGAVEMSREPGAAWDPARINLPVTTDTAFWAPPGSQAEVRIGSSAVRLDGNTQAVFTQLDDDAIVLDIAQGTVRARVRHLFEGDAFRLVADGVRVEAQEPGDYRVDYDPDRRAYTVRALAGRLRVLTPGTEFRLDAGQQTVVERGGASLQMSALGERDAFDAWAESRDRAQEQLAASRYVSPETTGIEALDEHGHWNVDDGYGPIWYPRVVAPGWAPYRYGHWTWVAPWGWSWVDDSPWGFAPFHYGRWALVGARWGWVPGPIVRRPVWAPALVGYVGGGGLSVSIGIGRPIGWFPLGPWEHYHPSYRYSPRYVRHIDVINVVPPRRVRHHESDRRDGREHRDPSRYRYAQRADAVTVVSEEGFRGSRPVGRERIPLRPDQTARLQPALAGWGAGLQPARPADNLLPPPPRRPDRDAREHRGWREQPDRPDRPDRRETPPRWAGDGQRGELPGRVGREPLPPRDFRDGRYDRGARTDGDGRRDRADRDDGAIGNRPGRIDPRPPAPRAEMLPQPVPRPLPGMQPVPAMPADRPLPSVRPVPPMPADRPLPAVRPVPPLQGAEPPPRRQPFERPPRQERQERNYDGPRERSPALGRPAAEAPVGRPDRGWSAAPPRPVAQPAPRAPAAQAPVMRAPVERARFERQARPDRGPQGRNPRALER